MLMVVFRDLELQDSLWPGLQIAKVGAVQRESAL